MGKTLALDLGEAQIGLAISDDHKLLARGLDTMKGKDRRNCMIVLGEIIRQQEVDEIVVGLPKNMNGSLGTQAEKALAFVQELKRQFGLPVRAWDERLTTSCRQEDPHRIRSQAFPEGPGFPRSDFGHSDSAVLPGQPFPADSGKTRSTRGDQGIGKAVEEDSESILAGFLLYFIGPQRCGSFSLFRLPGQRG